MNNKELRIYKKWLANAIQKDTLTKHEIEQILDGQLELSEKEIDGNLVQECLLYLYPEYEKGELAGEKESRDKFMQNWKEVNSKKKHSLDNLKHVRRFGHLRPAIVILYVVMGVMLLGTAVAYALGYPIWNYVFHWGDEQVRIDFNIQVPENSPTTSAEKNYFGLGKGDAFDEKLKELQFDPVLPRLPEEYLFDALDSSAGTTICNVIGFYSAGDKSLHISITRVLDVNAALGEMIEKDGNEHEMITVKEKSYYLFNNLDTSEIIWVSPPYIIQLGGDLTKDGLLSIIKTMDRGI